MALPNPRVERAKQIVFNECSLNGLSKEAIQFGIDMTEEKLIEGNLSIASAVREGVKFAEGEQKRIDGRGRRLLREMIS